MKAFKRMSNILEDYKNNSGSDNVPENVRTELFSTKEERDLEDLAASLRQALEKSLMYQAEYEGIFKMLADSKPTVDAFFDNVMVMDDHLEVRNNRIGLLHSVIAPIRQLLDLGELK